MLPPDQVVKGCCCQIKTKRLRGTLRAVTTIEEAWITTAQNSYEKKDKLTHLSALTLRNINKLLTTFTTIK